MRNGFSKRNLELIGKFNLTYKIAKSPISQSMSWTHYLQLMRMSNDEKKIKNYYFLIQGIHCDSKGNYGFETDKDFKKINLIEINIPQGAESILDEDICQLAKRIASHFKWQIDWNG